MIMKANEVEHGSPSSASDSTIRKRGRRHKSGHAESSEARRSYWLGEVFVDQGWAWGTELVEVEPVDGRRCWQVCPLCLGREDEIVPILRGYGQIPEDMHPRRRALISTYYTSPKGNYPTSVLTRPLAAGRRASHHYLPIAKTSLNQLTFSVDLCDHSPLTQRLYYVTALNWLGNWLLDSG